MAKYKLNNDINSVIDTESGMSIPLTGGNRHYAEFVEWYDNGNKPDNSIDTNEFISEKFGTIKKAFEDGAKNGYTVKSGIKYDSELTDYILLKGALDLAAATNQTELRVRDYDNKVHLISVTQFANDIIEIASAYKVGMEAKWAAQEDANNEGYSQFAQAELLKLAVVIEGNR